MNGMLADEGGRPGGKVREREEQGGKGEAEKKVKKKSSGAIQSQKRSKVAGRTASMSLTKKRGGG